MENGPTKVTRGIITAYSNAAACECGAPLKSRLLDERLVGLGLLGGADGGDDVGDLAGVRRHEGRVDDGVVIVVLKVDGGAAAEQRRHGAELTTPGDHVQRRPTVVVLTVDEAAVLGARLAQRVDDTRQLCGPHTTHDIVCAYVHVCINGGAVV